MTKPHSKMPCCNQHWFELIKDRDIVRRALKVALVVGTLLTLINHGPALLEYQLTSHHYLQIALTYLVPYLVSTYSAVIVRLEKN